MSYHQSPIARQWAEALDGMVLRHPSGSCANVELHDDAEPLLVVSVSTPDTVTGVMHDPLSISCIRLTYFPGAELARRWLAAGWAGYVQHEALELVTHNGVRPLDPHAGDGTTAPWNRGLKHGLPPVLNPSTLVAALAVVMPIDDAIAMAGEA